MKRRSRTVSTCFLLLSVLVSVKESQAQDSSYQSLSDKFFDLLGQGKGSDAVDFLFDTNPDLRKMTDEATQLKTQFSSLQTLMGSYVSRTRLVETEVAGINTTSSLIRDSRSQSESSITSQDRNGCAIAFSLM